MLAVEFARFLGLQFTGRANITDIVDAVCATAAHTRVRAGLRRRAAQPQPGHPHRRRGVRPAEVLRRTAAGHVRLRRHRRRSRRACSPAPAAGRSPAGSPSSPPPPFAYGTTAQREQWRALVATLESTLRLHQHQPGSLVALDEYLYRRSGGMIGSLSQLIRGAAILAIEDGSEQITRDLLDAVPVDYAAERAATASRPARRRSRAAAAERADAAAPAADRRPTRPAGNRRLLPGPAGQPARPDRCANCGNRSAVPRPGAGGATFSPTGWRPSPATTASTSSARCPSSHPAPDWSALRHQPQPGCPRCDARHAGGPVTRLLPHHRYVCTRHRYWIGPPDVDQRATALRGLDDIVGAQRHHLRLLRRYGAAATYDAVLTGFLFSGHLWADRRRHDGVGVQRGWTRRADVLIPPGTETATFSASRLFAAVYPEAVSLAGLIASPTWRHRAAGDADQQQQFITEVRAPPGPPARPLGRQR